MNEFLPRMEPVAAVASAQSRASTLAQAGAQAGIAQAAAVQPSPGREVQSQSVSARDAATATAHYARIQADVARALQAVKDRQPAATPADLGSAEQAMLDLMPQPVVMLPMPPADPEIVEFVAQIAQSLAQQQVQARAVHARISPSVVAALVA